MSNRKTLVALDIGSSKIRTIVGTVDEERKNIVNVMKDFIEDNDSQQNVLRIFTSGDVNLFKKNLQMMGIDDEVNFLTI